MSWKISKDRSTIFTRKRKNIKNKVGQTNEVVDALQVGDVDINAFKFWCSASASAEGKRVITARVSSGGLALKLHHAATTGMSHFIFQMGCKLDSRPSHQAIYVRQTSP